MGKIKGWKKIKYSVMNWDGYYYKSDRNSVITFTSFQDRDGNNAFVHIAQYKQDGLGKIPIKTIAKARNEDLVKKKVIDYMRSHPNG